MHSHTLTTSKGHTHSLTKETKEDSSNNADQDFAKDPLKRNTIPPTHLAGSIM